eukprot:1133646-Pelagomonas_calceolata.AAC.12
MRGLQLKAKQGDVVGEGFAGTGLHVHTLKEAVHTPKRLVECLYGNATDGNRLSITRHEACVNACNRRPVMEHQK